MRKNERTLQDTVRHTYLAVSAALLISSCSAKEADQLLATDLTYFKQQDGWTRTIEISPWLASRPDLVRHLKNGRVKTMEEDKSTCSASYGCSEDSVFSLYHNGDLLVSLAEDQSRDGGGAHGIAGTSDYLYDVRTKSRIRFGDLFSSWSDVNPIIEEAFCTELRAQYSDLEECPAAQDQAIMLQSYPFTGKINALIIETNDYALGYYAAGRATIRLELTREIFLRIKAEYQPEFEAPTS